MLLFLTSFMYPIGATLTLPKNTSQEEVIRHAHKEASVTNAIGGLHLQKVVFIPDRLINFVLQHS